MYMGENTEAIEGTVVNHGEGCICDEIGQISEQDLLGGLAAFGAILKFVRENQERFAAAGINIPSLGAEEGADKGDDLTAAEELLLELGAEAYKVGVSIGEMFSNPFAGLFGGELPDLAM
jgi:hypothetical protein